MWERAMFAANPCGWATSPSTDSGQSERMLSGEKLAANAWRMVDGTSWMCMFLWITDRSDDT